MVGSDHLTVSAEHVVELARLEDCNVARVGTGTRGCIGLTDFRGDVLPLIEVRQLLGYNSFRGEIRAAKEFVEQRERDHVLWLDELKRCASTGDPFKLALDPKQCAFGQWYETIRTDGPERERLIGGSVSLAAIIDSFDHPHRRIHALAEEVLGLATTGRIHEAVALVNSARDTVLEELVHKFNTYYEAYRKLRLPSLLIIGLPGFRFALVVDQVEAVCSYPEESFDESPGIAQSSGGFVTHTINDGHDIVLRLDVQRIAKHVLVGARAA